MKPCFHLRSIFVGFHWNTFGPVFYRKVVCLPLLHRKLGVSFQNFQSKVGMNRTFQILRHGTIFPRGKALIERRTQPCFLRESWLKANCIFVPASPMIGGFTIDIFILMPFNNWVVLPQTMEVHGSVFGIFLDGGDATSWRTVFSQWLALQKLSPPLPKMDAHSRLPSKV